MPDQQLKPPVRRSDSDLEKNKKAAFSTPAESQPLLPQPPQSGVKSTNRSSLQSTQSSSSAQQSHQQSNLPQMPSRPTQLSAFSLPLFGWASQHHHQQQQSQPQPQAQQHKRKSSSGWLRKLSGHTPTTPPKGSFESPPLKVTIEKEDNENEHDLENDISSAKEDGKKSDDASASKTTTETSKEASKTAELKSAVLTAQNGNAATIGLPPSGPVDQGFDLDDLHRTQKSLLELRSKFDAGKLKVFETEEALTRMKQVREQQERLAKLHFDLHAAQSATDMYTQSARTSSLANLKQLMSGLQSLKHSVERMAPLKANCGTAEESQNA